MTNVESPWPAEAIQAMQRRNLRVSFTWMPALSVHVGATFPLLETADAHRALEAGQVTGRAVLVI